MAGKRFRFNDAAAAELEAAVRWYSEQKPDLTLAADLLEEVEQKIAAILEAPGRWPPSGGVRRALLERFPFAVLYRELPGDEIEIVSIFHLKRRPGAWRGR